MVFLIQKPEQAIEIRIANCEFWIVEFSCYLDYVVSHVDKCKIWLFLHV